MRSATTTSDKTDTLTFNRIIVGDADVGGQGVDPADNKSQLSPIVPSLLMEGIAQNTNGRVIIPQCGGDPEVSDLATEKPILVWAVKAWNGI